MNIAVIQPLEPGGFAPGRLGSLSVRLALTQAEVTASQRLRHRVFFESMPQGPDWRDEDRFDAHCDHLLVFDHAVEGNAEEQIVGTYRLLRQESARRADGWCSQSEFDVADLTARWPRRQFLELGRSCVLPHYRCKRTVELLWQGIWAYCRVHGIDVMFGCASFPGILPVRHALPLSLLFHHARAGVAWSAAPVSGMAVSMDLVPAEAVDPKRALASMPPLVKAYLRLGARFGGSAVIDPHFGTTDVLVVLRVEDIPLRYLDHYSQDFSRIA